MALRESCRSRPTRRMTICCATTAMGLSPTSRQKSGLGDTEWSSGVAVGDYNNDGFLDLYVTNFGPNKLYRNNGNGTFSDVSEKSGVAGPHWDMPKWSMGAAFGDYDNDGYLDLYVTNFARFNYQPELPPPSPASPCRMKGVPDCLPSRQV